MWLLFILQLYFISYGHLIKSWVFIDLQPYLIRFVMKMYIEIHIYWTIKMLIVIILNINSSFFGKNILLKCDNRFFWRLGQPWRLANRVAYCTSGFLEIPDRSESDRIGADRTESDRIGDRWIRNTGSGLLYFCI